MRKRLDQVMAERGLAATRSRARDTITRGLVSVDGGAVDKAGALVSDTSAIAVAPESGLSYVSRGALKLAAGLDAFAFDVLGRTALDIGTSTGGFTEILLERGAERVYAVDVGRGQLHAKLRADPRVHVMEATDARGLTTTAVPQPVTAITADVSFISLAKVLPAGLALADGGCWLVALVKPQFEVGPEHIAKGGLVREEALRQEAVEAVTAWLAMQQGWRVVGHIDSPIAGGSGNKEFLLGAVHDG